MYIYIFMCTRVRTLVQAYASVSLVSECGSNTQLTLMVRQPSKWHCFTCVILPGHGTESQGWVPGIPGSSVTVRSLTLLNQCQLIAHRFRVKFSLFFLIFLYFQNFVYSEKIAIFTNFYSATWHLWHDRVYQISILLFVDEGPYTTYKIFKR